MEPFVYVCCSVLDSPKSLCYIHRVLFRIQPTITCLTYNAVQTQYTLKNQQGTSRFHTAIETKQNSTTNSFACRPPLHCSLEMAWFLTKDIQLKDYAVYVDAKEHINGCRMMLVVHTTHFYLNIFIWEYGQTPSSSHGDIWTHIRLEHVGKPVHSPH